MEKLIARAALALVLTGSLLAAPATIKVVKDPARLPQPFSRLARADDVFVSDGRYAALIAVTSRPAWSAINYGHPDIAGFVAAFVYQASVNPLHEAESRLRLKERATSTRIGA